MDEAIECAVIRVISAMRDNLGEEFTVDDMARTAMFSKFHFCRIFRRATGISPGRFLSALRLQEAKRLLLTTDWKVADISNRVGYSSVGTFSSRFKYSVSVSPTTYRQYGGSLPAEPRRGGETTTARPPTVRGEILPPASGDIGVIFTGLFRDQIPQGSPVRRAILSEPGPYVFSDIPAGTWYILSRAFVPSARQDGLGDLSFDGQSSFAGTAGPITIRRDTVMLGVNLQLRSVHALDPPMLLAIPGLGPSVEVSIAI